ncbi:MAG: PfkB family carbohydrate kinase [Gaiellaceae bacterium]
MIAVVGNLSKDIVEDGEPRVGGGPYYTARALRLLQGEARILTRCAETDRALLVPPLVALGIPVTVLPAATTASFRLGYTGDHRWMEVAAVGDAWTPAEVSKLGRADWVHVAPLLRSDFPAETLAELAHGRRLLLDGQGLVRAPHTGPLELDAEFDPELLRHVSALKLSEEEAEALGDPEGLGVAEVLVTHGSRGTTVFADGRATEIPAGRVAAVDPTGAGDAFSVAYVAARASGQPPVPSARRAAALVTRLLGDP